MNGSGLREEFVEFLHKAHGALERAEFVRCHGVGIKMHDVVADDPDLFKQRRENSRINFQIQFRPDLWVLKKTHVLSQGEVSNVLRRRFY